MVTIISDETVREIGDDILETLREDQKEVRHFSLDGMEIKPCYACGGCAKKTYKRCIIRDDADQILPCLARSTTIIIVTPILFGSYSYKTKLVIDKLALIGDLHYYYKNGELVKSLNPSNAKYFVVGIASEENPKKAAAFQQLVQETLQLTSWIGKAIIAPAEAIDIHNIAKEITGHE